MTRNDRMRSRLPRTAASVAATLLMSFAAAGWYVTGLMLGLVGAGHVQIENASTMAGSEIDAHLSGLMARAGHAALWMIDHGAHTLLYNATSSSSDFHRYAAVAFAAAVVAALTALARRPDRMWPEVVWIATAILAFAPALAVGAWVWMWAVPAMLLTLATVCHFKRRKGWTMARGVTAAVVLAPEVGATAKRGADAVGTRATAVAKRGAEELTPRAQAAAERSAQAAKRGAEALTPHARSAALRGARALARVRRRT